MPSPFTPNSKIAAYMRDSGGEKQALSIDQQEDEIRKWCKLNGISLTHIFQDLHRTGTTTENRAGFTDMIDYFRQKPKPPEIGIVIYKFSRFARNLDDAQFYKADLHRRGFEVFAITDPIPEGLNGRLIEFNYDWMYASFIKGMTEEATRGCYYVARQGAFYGNPPRGFKRQPFDVKSSRGEVHHVNRLAKDPDLWETCKRAWEMRSQGATLGEIHRVTHIYNSINSYTTFFTNPIYKGEYHYGDLVTVDYVEPMVSARIWQAVNDLIKTRINIPGKKENSAGHPKRVRSPFLLSGLLYCARCGSPMNGTNKNDYESYTCGRKHRNRDCDARDIPRLPIEQAVLNECLDMVLTVRNLRRHIASDYPAHNGTVRAHMREQKKLLELCKREISNLVEAIAVQRYSAALLDKLEELEKKKADLETEIRSLERNAQIRKELTPEQIELIVKNLSAALRASGFEGQRQALQGFIRKIVVERLDKKIACMIIYIVPASEISGNGVCPHGVPLHSLNFIFRLPKRAKALSTG